MRYDNCSYHPVLYRLRGFLFLILLAAATAIGAGPTNSILFVTQAPVPADFGTIASTFGNHQGNPGSCGRGGDLYVRYPDGTLKNLTRAAGYGQWGPQAPNGIAAPAMRALERTEGRVQHGRRIAGQH
jgi:hypothetical protein